MVQIHEDGTWATKALLTWSVFLVCLTTPHWLELVSSGSSLTRFNHSPSANSFHPRTITLPWRKSVFWDFQNLSAVYKAPWSTMCLLGSPACRKGRCWLVSDANHPIQNSHFSAGETLRPRVQPHSGHPYVQCDSRTQVPLQSFRPWQPYRGA